MRKTNSALDPSDDAQITLAMEDFNKLMDLTDRLKRALEISEQMFNMCKGTGRMETSRIQEMLIDLRLALGQ